jgi:hypothetical protein
MGEWERKAEAKAHEQRTDDSVEATPGSPGNQSDIVLVMCFKTIEGTVVPHGASVRLVDRKRERVEVFLVGRCVGEVCDEDSLMLRELFGIATRTGSSFGGQCISAEASTPHFTVEVTI